MQYWGKEVAPGAKSCLFPCVRNLWQAQTAPSYYFPAIWGSSGSQYQTEADIKLYVSCIS